MIHNLKKKTRQDIIKGLVAIMLLTIVVNQLMWILDMYQLYIQEFESCVEQSARQSVWLELSDRQEKIGGEQYIGFGTSLRNDTSRFIVKNVVTADSTYTVTMDRHDINSSNKITQLVLKDFLPIDLYKLDSIFVSMVSKDYMIQDSYFEYIDLENGYLLQSNQTSPNLANRYYKTDTIPLDINNSIGIVGFMQTPVNDLIARMLKQLTLSIILIIIAMGGMFYLSKSFITQWKTEKMRQEFVNVLTHEFKRPISSVIAMVSTIPFYVKENNIDKVLEYACDIEIAMNKLAHYTKRIQQISNNDKSDVRLNKTAIEINSFFESLQRRYDLREEHGQKVVVKLRLATSKKKMDVDMLHFSNVMDNLIENAIKYTVHPTIQIGVKVEDPEKGVLMISVEDNGMGISSQDKKRVFDKFYRVKREETKSKMGFGLGLTYVKSIIEAHGGDIIVNSELDKGSEFIIMLKC